MCCRSCGFRGLLGDTLFSALLGWWGFPWGFILTPVQIARNLRAMASPPDPLHPSAQLVYAARLDLAAKLVRAQASALNVPAESAFGTFPQG